MDFISTRRRTSANSPLKGFRLLLFVAISLLFSGFVHSDQGLGDDESVKKYKLLVLGDSLSAAYGLTEQQGWVAILSHQWREENSPIEVINAAISGDTTDGGLARLPRLLELHAPTHLYIELGGNNGLQGHNPKIIKRNLAAKIALAKENDVDVILQEIQIPTNYGRRYSDMFINNYHQLAEEFNVPLVPFFLREIALDTSLMQNDGIHPTAEAQTLIVDFLKPKLEALIL